VLPQSHRTCVDGRDKTKFGDRDLLPGFCLLISAPTLGIVLFFVVDSVCPSVHLSVTLLLQIDSFLFLDGIEPFFGHHLSMWHSTKRCSTIFDLGCLTPKIYSPKLLAITLHYHVATRGRALGTAALIGESRQSTELRG